MWGIVRAVCGIAALSAVSWMTAAVVPIHPVAGSPGASAVPATADLSVRADRSGGIHRAPDSPSSVAGPDVVGVTEGIRMVGTGTSDARRGSPAAPVSRRTPPTSTARARTAVPLIAYRTPTEFVLRRDSAEEIRVPGDFAGSEPVAFTRDGRFAFTVATGSIVSIGVADGAISRVGCACTSAVALREDLVVWSQDAVVMRAALGDPGAAARHQPVRWPDSPTPLATGAAFGTTELLAASAHSVLLARRETVDGAWTGTHWYAVADEGDARALGRVDGIDTDVAASVGPDGHTFVISGTHGGDSSCPKAAVATVDAGTARVTALAAPPGTCSTAHRPNAESDGTITAILQHWSSASTAETGRATGTTRTWSDLTDHPVLESRRRSDGAIAELVATTPAAPGALPLGRLTVSTASTRTVLADNVSAVATR